MPAGHATPFAQLVVPVGQDVMPPHDAGRSLGSWPGQRMQVWPPHCVLPQSATFVHDLQMFGSLIVDRLQPGDVFGFVAMSRQTFVTGSQSVQQPKQSQPGGVSAPQTILH